MPVYQLDHRILFPPAAMADEDGLLCIGGDLRPERLIAAYARGIFPWPHAGYPLLWFCPARRMVLPVSELHVPRRLARRLRQARFEIRLDTACPSVIRLCASVARADGEGTWITGDMIEAFSGLHRLGVVHSAEAWREERLAGGLYGVCLGGLFVAESMFTIEPDAAKVALVALVRQLDAWGIELFDAQLHTEHIARFGAREWPRARYLAEIGRLVRRETRMGPWRMEIDPARTGSTAVRAARGPSSDAPGPPTRS